MKPSDFFYSQLPQRATQVIINGSNNNNNNYLYLGSISLGSLLLWVSYGLLCSKKPSRLMTFCSEHVSERSSCLPLLQQYYVNNFISQYRYKEQGEMFSAFPQKLVWFLACPLVPPSSDTSPGDPVHGNLPISEALQHGLPPCGPWSRE